nr:hypothetical protein [Tanacetum cinerariifolium]
MMKNHRRRWKNMSDRKCSGPTSAKDWVLNLLIIVYIYVLHVKCATELSCLKPFGRGCMLHFRIKKTQNPWDNVELKNIFRRQIDIANREAVYSYAEWGLGFDEAKQ